MRGKPRPVDCALVIKVLPELILASIRKHQPSETPPVLLACSGGIDSQVLLHGAAAVWPAASLIVAHVHHGLQPQADDWLSFCEANAAGMGLRFLARRLPPLPDNPRSGAEAWARRLRYQALSDMAAQCGASIVLTAHHANDQLETHELRRMRGAGPLGLGAMRSGAPLPGSPHQVLLRPFLGVQRQRIVDYAREHRIEWVEDPSNQDLRFARNRVRRQVAQALARDPRNLQRGLAVIDGYQQQADAVQRQARQDLATCRLMLASSADGSLSRASLARLAPERTAEAIRLWLREMGCRMPSSARLAEMVRQLIDAQSTQARLQHDGLWLLRYRDRIDAAADLPAPLRPTWFRWSGESLLNVAGQQFLFHLRPAAGDSFGAGAAGASGVDENWLPGIDPDWLSGVDLAMDRARSNDRLRLAPRGRRRTWKNLSQERGIAPWVRAALPVLRHGGELLYAAPFGMNSPDRLGILDALNASAAGDDPLTAAWSPATGWSPSPGGMAHSCGGQAPRGLSRVVIEWVVPAHYARWL